MAIKRKQLDEVMPNKKVSIAEDEHERIASNKKPKSFTVYWNENDIELYNALIQEQELQHKELGIKIPLYKLLLQKAKKGMGII